MSTDEANRKILERLRGYSDEALARVVVANRVIDVSTSAMDIIPAAVDGDSDVLGLVERAVLLRRSADRLTEEAVIAARAAGRSWTDIGEVLGITKQSAQGRFKAAEDQWIASLLEPVVHPGDYDVSRLPDGLENPDQAVWELDEWLASRALGRSATEALPKASDDTRASDLMRRFAVIARRWDTPEGVSEVIEEDYRLRKVACGHYPDTSRWQLPQGGLDDRWADVLAELISHHFFGFGSDGEPGVAKAFAAVDGSRNGKGPTGVTVTILDPHNLIRASVLDGLTRIELKATFPGPFDPSRYTGDTELAWMIHAESDEAEIDSWFSSPAWDEDPRVLASRLAAELADYRHL